VCSSVSGRFFLRAYRTHSPFTAPVSDQARAAIARAKAKHLFWNNMRYALSASVMKPLTPISSLILAGLWITVLPANAQVNVTQEHNHLSRDGLYVDSRFTRPAAANVRRDLNFNGTISGNVYAQPLYIEGGPSGRARVIVVTESNNIYALDRITGTVIWQRNVGAPVTSGLPCGNINPLGITGTPVVHLASRSLFFDAMINGPTKRHFIFSLNVDTGAINPG
jgi:PQQ enzyme repeat